MNRGFVAYCDVCLSPWGHLYSTDVRSILAILACSNDFRIFRGKKLSRIVDFREFAQINLRDFQQSSRGKRQFTFLFDLMLKIQLINFHYCIVIVTTRGGDADGNRGEKFTSTLRSFSFATYLFCHISSLPALDTLFPAEDTDMIPKCPHFEALYVSCIRFFISFQKKQIYTRTRYRRGHFACDFHTTL